jgi:predicted O-methyltransferase YrrM
MTVLSELIYGWGYGGSVEHEYANAILQHARITDGPILECGSGLSTILLGVVAQKNGNRVWSLEHIPHWAQKVRSTLKRYGIESVELCDTQLRDYGAYSWYDPPQDKMPKGFSLVVCDGPPAYEGNMTPGGRYGMLPVMKPLLEPGCVVLLDDAARVKEREIIARWADELGTSYRIEGVEKPFAIVSVVGKD